mgnify:CR=1 FL=1
MVRGLAGIPLSEKRQLTELQISDDVVGKLHKALGISNLRQSYVYNIFVTTVSAQKSTEIVNTLANLYIPKQLDVKGESNLQATAWLTERLRQLRIDLEKAEAQDKDFSAQNGNPPIFNGVRL